MMSFATTWLSDAIVFYLHPLGASQELGIFFIVFAACALLMLASALPKRTLATVMVVAVPRFLVDGGRWDYRQSPGRKIPAARKSPHRPPRRSTRATLQLSGGTSSGSPADP